jgi:transmembrane 9 superfamily member 1
MILLGASGYYSKAKGSLYSIMVVVYAFTSAISGYSSSRLYRHIGGTHWGLNIITTVLIFPVPSFLSWFVINNLAWIEGSTIALKFSTMFLIICVMLLISFPLTIFGGITGKIKSKDTILESEHKAPKIPKLVPAVPFYKNPFFSMFVSGIVPFLSCYIEIYYIFTSVWGHKIYNLYGVLIIQFFLLVIISCKFSYFFADDAFFEKNSHVWDHLHVFPAEFSKLPVVVELLRIFWVPIDSFPLIF